MEKKLVQTIDVTADCAIRVYDNGNGSYDVECKGDKIIVKTPNNYESGFVSQVTQFHREMRLKHAV